MFKFKSKLVLEQIKVNEARVNFAFFSYRMRFNYIYKSFNKLLRATSSGKKSHIYSIQDTLTLSLTFRQ